MTAIITGERGDGTLTRYGLEEYVSDCVILLDHRVVDQVTTRRHPHGQISRQHARHQRVPVPHRARWHLDLADHFRAPRTQRVLGARPERYRAAGRHARGQRILPGQQHSDLGHRGHWQDESGGDFCRGRVPAGRTMPLLFVRRISQPDHPQHGDDRDRLAAVGEKRDCSSFKPYGRFIAAWKCTSRG